MIQRHSETPETPDWGCGRAGCPGAARGSIVPFYSAGRPSDTRRTAAWRGEVHGRPPAHRFRGSGGSQSPGRTALLLCFIPQPRFVGCWPSSQKTLPPLSFGARSETWWVVVLCFFFPPSPLSLPFLRVEFSGSCVQCWELASSRDRWQSY